MQISKHINSLQQELAVLTMQGESLALVPTMGNLHAGHMSLVREARKMADRVVVSIFVNPTQFDRDEDLAAYPRTLDEDIEKLEKGRVDLLFAPYPEEIYGENSTTRIHVPELSDCLEGASRPGHFDGVATIVAKLFNLIQPDVALFGEKDFQQLLLIQRMVEDLNFPVSVIGVPTVREADGLAMSSRNGYLNEEERQKAPQLYAVLQKLDQALRQGEQDYPILQKRATKDLENAGFGVDYVSIMATSDLKEPNKGESQLVVLASVWLGSARLIDNILVNLAES